MTLPQKGANDRKVKQIASRSTVLFEPKNSKRNPTG